MPYVLFIPLMLGTTELLLLAGAALLIFGGKKLPEIMRSMGKGVKEFKEGVQGAPQTFKEGMRNENEGELSSDVMKESKEESNFEDN